MLPLAKAVNRYFGTAIRGWENVPQRGAMLIVGNHSGGAETSDIAPLLQKWVEDRGPKAPLYSLGYDLLFAYPIVGPILRQIGTLPASQANARTALRKGAAVVAFPGGDYEVFRPWSERNTIDFGGRTGFIELAIAMRVPVVPMTIHGAHQSTIVLTRGRRLARAAGLERLHIKVFPFIWNIPLGLTPAFVPSLQLPAKVTVEFGKALDWSRYNPHQATDPAVLKRCYDEITRVMQRTLDALARAHPYPVLTRLNELRPGQLIRGVAAALSNGTANGHAAASDGSARRRRKPRTARHRRAPGRHGRSSRYASRDTRNES
jgi:1-acyl-sn-glycerol-3-phosphate acyltransferase